MPELEGPWLYKIAHNVLPPRGASARRGAPASRRRPTLTRSASRAAAHTPDADRALRARRRARRHALEPPSPAAPARMAGMSYMEIADALGVSHSAVETLIFRARRHLAQALVDPVKKTGRAVASIFNIRWLYGLLKSLGGGAGERLGRGRRRNRRRDRRRCRDRPRGPAGLGLPQLCLTDPGRAGHGRDAHAGGHRRHARRPRARPHSARRRLRARAAPRRSPDAREQGPSATAPGVQSPAAASVGAASEP